MGKRITLLFALIVSISTWGWADDLKLSDDAPTLVAGTYVPYEITYTRSTVVDNYATLCLPFEYTLDSEQFQKAWIPTNVALVQNGVICLLFKQTSSFTIPAYTPIVVLCGMTDDECYFQNENNVTFTGSETDPAAQSITLYNYSSTGIMFENEDYSITYGGTVVGKAWESGLCQFNADGTFQKRDESAGALIPFRAYVIKKAKNASAKPMSVVTVLEDEEGKVTAIGNIENGEFRIDNAATYNLAGQRITSLQKGINIINGKKVLVK